MFYFHHPFGIQTPIYYGSCRGEITKLSPSSPTCEFYLAGSNVQAINNSSHHYRRQPYVNFQRQNSYQSNNTDIIRRRHASLVPWPRSTWCRDTSVPLLLDILAKQRGKWIIIFINVINYYY